MRIHSPEALHLHQGNQTFFAGTPGKAFTGISLVSGDTHGVRPLFKETFSLRGVRDVPNFLSELLSGPTDSSSFLNPSRRSFKSLRARMDRAIMASLREGAESTRSDSILSVAGLWVVDFLGVFPDALLSGDLSAGGILSRGGFAVFPESSPEGRNLIPTKVASKSTDATLATIMGLEKRAGRGMTGFVEMNFQQRQRGRYPDGRSGCTSHPPAKKIWWSSMTLGGSSLEVS